MKNYRNKELETDRQADIYIHYRYRYTDRLTGRERERNVEREDREQRGNGRERGSGRERVSKQVTWCFTSNQYGYISAKRKS